MEAERLLVTEHAKRKSPKGICISAGQPLKRAARPTGGHSQQEYRETAVKLQQTLRDFGVGVTVTNISCGPSVTRYELHPEQGVKVSKIVGLADDIKRVWQQRISGLRPRFPESRR